MNKIFYIADCHLGHNNVLNFDKRPFSSIEDMDKTIITNWNEVISKNDLVYVLGDFIWQKESLWPSYLEQLKGQIVLIKGNHDLKNMNANTKRYFADIKDYKEIIDGDNKVILCHYPIPFYKSDYQENYWMLHGHVHNTKENDELEDLRIALIKQQDSRSSNRAHFINVGCMMPWMNYYPKTIQDIITGFRDYMEEKGCKI